MKQWAQLGQRCGGRQTVEGSTAINKADKALKARSSILYFRVGQG